MTRRWGLIAAMPAAVGGIALATLGASAGSSAGKPAGQNALLCGLYMASDAVDNVSGNSNQDHVDGGDVSGGQYYNFDSSNSSCQQEYNSNGMFNAGAQTFTWKVSHSNVDVQRERGTEHGLFTLQNTQSWSAGFQGQISNYDFATPLTTQDTGDTASGGRTVYYVSGHAYDNVGLGSGAGNFNTHGGAASGAHYRGNYGVVIYQDNSNNTPCKTGSSMYCFEAILMGQVN